MSANRIAQSLTWLGGGEWRELGERHERSTHVIAGVVVLLAAALSWLVSALAVTESTHASAAVAVPLTLVFGLLVGGSIGAPHRLTGTVWAATACGDVTGDGRVDLGDALMVAQLDVGLRSCGELAQPAACDVNRDGVCDIGDAQRLAQCDVGLVSCEFTCLAFTCP